MELPDRAEDRPLRSEGAAEIRRISDEIARAGGTPLAVARNGSLLGVIHLKDILKAGMRERFGELRPVGKAIVEADHELLARFVPRSDHRAHQRRRE